MQHYGSIKSQDTNAPIQFEDWKKYIATSVDLIRPEARAGRNPANGKPIMLQPPADTVHMIKDGIRLATFSWGPPEHNCIIVQYDETEAAIVETRAKCVADAFGGTFCRCE